MRVRFVAAIILWLYGTTVCAQKKIIDREACESWVHLQDINGKSCITNSNGRFVVYKYGSPTGDARFVLSDMKTMRKWEFTDINNPGLLPNGNLFARLSGSDSFLLFNPVKNSRKIINFDADKPELLNDSDLPEVLNRLKIIRGFSAGVIFNADSSCFIYLREGVVYHLTVNGKKADTLLTKEYFKPFKDSMSIAGVNGFSKDGRMLFFTVATNTKKRVIERNIPVIWSYLDDDLRDVHQKGDAESYDLWVIDIVSKKTIRLEERNIRLVEYRYRNKYVLIGSQMHNESYWQKTAQNIFLVNLYTGEKINIISTEYPGSHALQLSPDEKYVIWFDGNSHQYYSYNIASGKTVKISAGINDSLSLYGEFGAAAKSIRLHSPAAATFWLNPTALLVHSTYDVWQLDISGAGQPINLTNSYGNKNKIRFRIVEDENHLPVWYNKRILLSAFNITNKQNGFWATRPSTQNALSKLVMENRCYYFNPSSAANITWIREPEQGVPVKASDADVFYCVRMSATEAPNLFYTTNFKDFVAVTNLNPQKKYNWVKPELIHYVLPNGTRAQGILHKPESLDPTRKYPVIFTYYERHSDYLNVFRYPAGSNAGLNIPWYTSRGYLVFEPDFYYQPGKVAESIISAAKAAVSVLSKFSYVDTSRMGLQGQSHGGYVTNVLATGINMFKAACEMAGYSNLFTEYGSVRSGGFSNQRAEDMDQRCLGTFPWDRPDVFAANSPVFFIDKMTTPLLIVHNPGDNAVSFNHAIEMSQGMKRLGKKYRLLSYNNEGHSNESPETKWDYTSKMQEFFDCYLKRNCKDSDVK